MSDTGTLARGCMYSSRPIGRRVCSNVSCPIYGNNIEHSTYIKTKHEPRNFMSTTKKMKMTQEKPTKATTMVPTTISTTTKTTTITSAPIKTTLQSESTPRKTTLTPMKTTSTPMKTTSTTIKTTSAPMKTKSTPMKTTSTPMKTTSTPIKTTSAPMKTTFKPTTTTTKSTTVIKTTAIRATKKQNSRQARKRYGYNHLRPFANLSKNRCFDLHSKAYCRVISVRLKFCKFPQYYRLCCKSCRKKNARR